MERQVKLSIDRCSCCYNRGSYGRSRRWILVDETSCNAVHTVVRSSFIRETSVFDVSRVAEVTTSYIFYDFYDLRRT